VSFLTTPPTPAKPVTLTAPPGAGPSGTYGFGETVTVSWPTYTGCPSGYSVTSYEFTVAGGSIPSASYGPELNDLPFTLRSDSGPSTISYTVKCGDLTSTPSETLTLTVFG